MKAKKSKSDKNVVAPLAENILLTQIVQSNYNPRRYFDEKKLLELSENIKLVGVIQPILVRPMNGKYEIVCGERRYRASLLAEQKTIPAIIRDNLTDDQAEDIALFENLERADISPIEEAAAIKFYIEKRKEDFKSLSKRLGKSEVYVRTRYTLNNLIEPIQMMLSKDELQLGMGLILASYENEVQENIYVKHLREDAYNSWRGISYTKFATNIEKEYSMSLLNATFDKTECVNCPFNSGLAQLFGEENPKCLKFNCFSKKQEEHDNNILIGQIEEHPDYIVFDYYENVPDFLRSFIEEKEGVVNTDSYDYELFSEAPEKPEASEYMIDGEIDEIDYNEALEQFNTEMTEYNNELEDIQSKIKNGEFAYCYIFDDEILKIGYYSIEALNPTEEEKEESQADSSEVEENAEVQEIQDEVLPKKEKKSFNFELQRIETLKAQMNRNGEIAVENSVRDIHDIFKTKSIEAVEKTDKEDFWLYMFLSYELETCKTYFYPQKQYGISLEDWYNVAEKFTDEDKTFIIREFLKKNFKSYAFGAKSFATNLFFDFANIHFESEATEIKEKYNKVCKARNEKIGIEIQSIQDYIKEETQKEQTPIQEEAEA